MRMFSSLTRKRGIGAGLALLTAATFSLYPTVDTSTRLYLAEKSLVARKTEDAIDWLKSIPERRTVGKREFLLARAYRRLGQQDFARQHLQTAFDLGFPVEQLEREQWLAMAQSGQMREAESYLRRLLQDPGDDGAEICESFVKGYFRKHEFSKAIPLLEAWKADFPNDPLPYVLHGAAFQEAEDWSAAIAEYRQALQRNPGDTDVRVQLAVCLKSTLNYDEAAAEFRKCLKTAPQDRILLAAWGDLLLSSGTVREATAVFQQLLAIDPTDPEARLAMAGIHLRNRNAEEALKIAQPLYAERPYDQRVMYSLASALQAAGNAQEAEKMYERVAEAQARLERKDQLIEELQHDPGLVDHRFEIAMISMSYESPADGVRWLLNVIDFDPGYAAAYIALADHYKSVGNAELELKFRDLAETHANDSVKP